MIHLSIHENYLFSIVYYSYLLYDFDRNNCFFITRYRIFISLHLLFNIYSQYYFTNKILIKR